MYFVDNDTPNEFTFIIVYKVFEVLFMLKNIHEDVLKMLFLCMPF